jgi:hypothetical protein
MSVRSHGSSSCTLWAGHEFEQGQGAKWVRSEQDAVLATETCLFRAVFGRQYPLPLGILGERDREALRGGFRRRGVVDCQ